MTKTAERIWIVLTILTWFAYLLGDLQLVGTWMVEALLISTFVKGGLIIDHFMGLKNVQYKYRLVPIIWLVLVISLVAISYYWTI
ncbi:MAG: cytochrome C oxidase subunit IV family protein [Sulfurospirillaceae bacterium]|nr:cytochrome C oxidase subunit IV family protein [Sulfurospirillaceae bacterium]